MAANRRKTPEPEAGPRITAAGHERKSAKAAVRELIDACKEEARKDGKLRRLAVMYGNGPNRRKGIRA
jgi:hypothetical protein